jgi:molybdopterin-guanine dinucleotide biosynthesis protein A
LALYNGLPLIDHVGAALAQQCDAVIVVGRDQHGYSCAPDYPAPDMGPLAGLAGALRYAQEAGFAEVLSAGVDAVVMPQDLRIRLAPAPAYVSGQPVIGLWPVAALSEIVRILNSVERHSMLHFAEMVGARAVAFTDPPANVNTVNDFQALFPQTS